MATNADVRFVPKADSVFERLRSSPHHNCRQRQDNFRKSAGDWGLEPKLSTML